MSDDFRLVEDLGHTRTWEAYPTPKGMTLDEAERLFSLMTEELQQQVLGPMQIPASALLTPPEKVTFTQIMQARSTVEDRLTYYVHLDHLFPVVHVPYRDPFARRRWGIIRPSRGSFRCWGRANLNARQRRAQKRRNFHYWIPTV